MKNLITVLAQSFYGNRVIVELEEQEIDDFIHRGAIGPLPTGDKYPSYKHDRTIVEVPGAENIVIMYNKYDEDEERERIKKYDDGSEVMPSAYFPEYDLKVYSRCIACRIDDDGNICSINEDDIALLESYLAK